jgi:hypothetical protein
VLGAERDMVRVAGLEACPAPPPRAEPIALDDVARLEPEWVWRPTTRMGAIWRALRWFVLGTQDETIVGLAEIAPNVSIGANTHSASVGLRRRGRWGAARGGCAGQAVQVRRLVPDPFGRQARTRVPRPTARRSSPTYVVEKGKPFATTVRKRRGPRTRLDHVPARSRNAATKAGAASSMTSSE